jgi:NAD(P)-dependent dehydrogenase (short-subunit alcohol dehydrogenase family)
VRRPSDASRLQQEFGERFTPLIFDITDSNAAREGARVVRCALENSRLFGLVNNAGIAVAGPMLQISADDFRHQFEVNVVGTLCVTQAFAAMLGTDETLSGAPGRIINISSIGGRIALPFLGPYAASKHALEGLSESLRRELMPFGIEVILIRPGGIATAMWDKAEAMDIPQVNGVYSAPIQRFRQRMVKIGRQGLPPERVGRVVLNALTSPRPKLKYSAVVHPLRNWVLPRMLPRRMIDRILSKQLGMNRGKTRN